MDCYLGLTGCGTEKWWGIRVVCPDFLRTQEYGIIALEKS